MSMTKLIRIAQIAAVVSALSLRGWAGGWAGLNFPILDGLRLGDFKENLTKVASYRKVLQDLGQNSLSEIHINDAGEVTVVSASDPVLVNLGKIDFRNRWIKYLQ